MLNPLDLVFGKREGKAMDNTHISNLSQLVVPFTEIRNAKRREGLIRSKDM